MTAGFTYRRYILKDHLGSWTTITDAEGNVEQELSYDAWGNLRDPETWYNHTQADPVEAPIDLYENSNGKNVNESIYSSSIDRLCDYDEYSEHSSNQSKSHWNKHSARRSGGDPENGRYGKNKNDNKGKKNKKFISKVNPNKKH